MNHSLLEDVSIKDEHKIELTTKGNGELFFSLPGDEYKRDVVGVILRSETTKQKLYIEAKEENEKYCADLSSIEDEIKGEREIFRLYIGGINEDGSKGFGFRGCSAWEIEASEKNIGELVSDGGLYGEVVELNSGTAAVVYAVRSSRRYSVLVDTKENVEKKAAGEKFLLTEKMLEKSYPYDFSVVMAVYNAEKELRQMVDSIVGQTIGMDRIQLIMVDDGSKDESGSICDEYQSKYPKNIKVIHKENEGVSVARNTGLEAAEGKYINFADSDDYFESDAFEKVWKFFEAHYNETNMVTIPVYRFEDEDGYHWQSYKFDKGSRVINLEKEWENGVMHVISTFIKHDAAKSKRFDERMPISEDLKYLAEVLMDNMNLGVVHNCRYMYRRKVVSANSLLATSKLKPIAYQGWLDHVAGDLFAEAKEKFGYIPKYIQNLIMMDLQWKLRMPKIPEGVLSKEEEESYVENVLNLIDTLDDDVILSQRKLYREVTLALLKHKYKNELLTEKKVENVVYTHHGQWLGAASEVSFHFDELSFEDGHLSYEGHTLFSNYSDAKEIKIYHAINGNFTEDLQIQPRKSKSYIFDTQVNQVGFKGDISVDKSMSGKKISFYLSVDGYMVKMKRLRFGDFTPFRSYNASEYFIRDGYAFSHTSETIAITKLDEEHTKEEFEMAYTQAVRDKVKEKAQKNANYTRTDEYSQRLEELDYRKTYFGNSVEKKKPIWLVSDQEAFFSYLNKKILHREDYYYVLDKRSEDKARLEKIGKVVERGSKEHRQLQLLADYVVSSLPREEYQDAFYNTKIHVQDLEHFKYIELKGENLTKDDFAKVK
ncbi:MAG: glycosyltransferase [Lachnospiraceae bacterium]|nr:glycosyltransferase [Lachnospiraceae bacterium]